MTLAELAATLPKTTVYRAHMITETRYRSIFCDTWLDAAAALRKEIMQCCDMDQATVLCGFIKQIPHGTDFHLSVFGMTIELSWAVSGEAEPE